MRWLPFVLCLCSAPLAAQGHVWVVDGAWAPGPEVDFADIQSAVDAAADGDAIVVRERYPYVPFTVDGKSLTILGAPGETPQVSDLWFQIESPVVIRNIDSSRSVTVRGMRLAAGTEVHDCSGTVWFEACELDSWVPAASEADALRLSGSSSVLLTDCTVTGGDQNAHAGQPGGAAVTVDAASSLFAFDSVFEGAPGTAPCQFGLTGSGAGPAVVVRGSMFASDCTLAGGQGADEGSCLTFPHGVATDGGDGVQVLGSAASLETLACTFVPGSGGLPTSATEDGVPVVLEAGIHDVLEGTPASSTSMPVLEGDELALTFTGVDGGFVFLLASPAADFTFLRGVTGPLGPSLPSFVHPVGILPTEGALVLSLQAGTPAVGTSFTRLFTQPLVVTPTLEAVLGAPTVLVVLAAAELP